MGECEIQQDAGLRSEAVSDRTIDSQESIGTGDQHSAPVRLEWKRAKKNNRMIRDMEKAFRLVGSIINKDAKNIQKQIKQIEKMRNVS